MILTILIVIIAFLGVIKYRSLFKGYEHIDSMFPGRRTWPLIGNVLEFYGDGHKAFNTGVSYVFEYRKSFRVWIGPIPYIVIISPRDLEIVLSSTNLLEKADSYDFLLPWIGRGLLTSYGERWRKHRKLLTPAFHFKILDGFLDIFNENSQILCQILEGEVGVKSINAMDYMKLCALDNICQTAMGISIDAQHNPNSEYVHAIKKMCEIVFKRTLSPWLRPEWLFSLTGYGRAQKECLKILHNFSRKVVENRIEARKKLSTEGNYEDNLNTGIKTRKAFLDLLLDLADEGTFTIEDIMEEVDTFMFEGHDTITSALSYITHNLAHYPEYQEKAYQEQVNIFGYDNRPVTQKDLQEMKYLEMFIKETLRLYSSVPVIGRRVKQDIQLDFRAVVPRGAFVLIPIIGLHRNPDIWERPTEFYPDHFLPEKTLARHPFSYVPFSAGPRNCIGMKFALVEMKSTISLVLRKFCLLPAVIATNTKPTVEVVTGSLTGFQISLQPRLKNKQ